MYQLISPMATETVMWNKCYWWYNCKLSKYTKNM